MKLSGVCDSLLQACISLGMSPCSQLCSCTCPASHASMLALLQADISLLVARLP